MTDHSSTVPARPDYDLAEQLEVSSATALKALADPTRSTIIGLLEERAASVGQLAEALDKPKSTIDHHVKALEASGLIRVVRTRKVRAITERFYGRTARWFLMTGLKDTSLAPDFAVQQAFDSLRVDPALPATATARYARIPAARAAAYRDELVALIDRFKDEPAEGATVYAMVVGVFPTERPYLSPADPTTHPNLPPADPTTHPNLPPADPTTHPNLPPADPTTHPNPPPADPTTDPNLPPADRPGGAS